MKVNTVAVVKTEILEIKENKIIEEEIVNKFVTKSVFEAYFDEPKYRPSYIQRKMVDANLLGRKTKRGFYKYD